MRSRAWLVVLFLLLGSCTTKMLSYKKSDQLSENKELSTLIQIQEVDSKGAETVENLVKEPLPSIAPAVSAAVTTPSKKSSDGRRVRKAQDLKSSPENVIEPQVTPTAVARRLPELESNIGFEGRRPLRDPFRVGERITHEVKYFEAVAGLMTFSVEPFVQVNGRKSYNFTTRLKTSSLFSRFYSVDDKVSTYVDFATLVPLVYKLEVKESGQLKDAQLLFDHNKLRATYWEKKYTKRDGETSKKEEWEILPFSQNVFSAIFYMRVFHWDVGVENAFRIANDKENLIFKGKALRRETLKTEAGEFQALVIKPEIQLKGKFNPAGDIFIWISDDERKLILRVEAKIKIGTLVTEVVKIE